MIRIGDNARAIRKAKGIGQTELVRKLQLMGVEMTRETLVKIERGIQHIYAGQLRAMRDALETSYDELLMPFQNISYRKVEGRRFLTETRRRFALTEGFFMEFLVFSLQDSPISYCAPAVRTEGKERFSGNRQGIKGARTRPLFPPRCRRVVRGQI